MSRLARFLAETRSKRARSWNDKGCALHAAGRTDEAREAFLRAVRLDAGLAEAHNNLGAIAAGRGDLDEACRRFALAAAAAPEYYSAHYNLGRALKEAGKDTEADAALARAAALRPNGPAALYRALAVPMVLDDASQAQAVRKPMDAWLASDTPVAVQDPVAEIEPSWFALAYHGIDDTARYRGIARRFARSIPGLQYTAPHCAAGRRRAGRLRVGFISRYLHDHSIGRTTRGVIPRLSRERFEVYALFVAPVVDDPISREIRDGADFAVVIPASLETAREVISGLELDVLFYQDLGMESFTYFLAFSRLAPAQGVGWGHPVTSGIPAIDFFISTEGFEPPGAERHYSERLIRLSGVATPSFYLRPERDGARLSRGEAGFDESRTAYFCPQTFYKLHPDFDPVLAAILRADPRGVVYLLQHKSRAAAARLQARFTRGMPDVAGRIRFLPRVPGLEHYYSRLKHADVLLDTMHFGGGNTSLEGLAFGSPIVTLPGEFMRGRHTLGMYLAMGLEGCIARSPGHYAELAVALATDRARREDVRRRIEARSAALYEDARVVGELEKALLVASEAPA